MVLFRRGIFRGIFYAYLLVYFSCMFFRVFLLIPVAFPLAFLGQVEPTEALGRAEGAREGGNTTQAGGKWDWCGFLGCFLSLAVEKK